MSFEVLMHPHWEQARALIEAQSAVLLVQDTTDVDCSHHPKTSGVSQIGNGQGRGLDLHLVPETGEMLGCAIQGLFVRTLASAGETRSQRR